jgi:hypothetical protein
MTADILQFRKKEESYQKINIFDLFVDVSSEVVADWGEQTALTVNEWINSKLPKNLQKPRQKPYIHDLLHCSRVEQALGIKVIIHAPGTLETADEGWVAGFKLDESLYATGVGMVSESFARWLNIMVWLAFTAELELMKDYITKEK